MKIKEMPTGFYGIEYANDKTGHLTLIGDFDYDWGCDRDNSEELADGRYWEDSEWGVRIKSGKGVAIRRYPGGCKEYFAQGITISEAERLIKSEDMCWFKNLGPVISIADHNDPDPMHNNHF